MASNERWDGTVSAKTHGRVVSGVLVPETYIKDRREQVTDITHAEAKDIVEHLNSGTIPLLNEHNLLTGSSGGSIGRVKAASLGKRGEIRVEAELLDDRNADYFFQSILHQTRHFDSDVGFSLHHNPSTSSSKANAVEVTLTHDPKRKDSWIERVSLVETKTGRKEEYATPYAIRQTVRKMINVCSKNGESMLEKPRHGRVLASASASTMSSVQQNAFAQAAVPQQAAPMSAAPATSLSDTGTAPAMPAPVSQMAEATSEAGFAAEPPAPAGTEESIVSEAETLKSAIEKLGTGLSMTKSERELMTKFIGTMTDSNDELETKMKETVEKAKRLEEEAAVAKNMYNNMAPKLLQQFLSVVHRVKNVDPETSKRMQSPEFGDWFSQAMSAPQAAVVCSALMAHDRVLEPELPTASPQQPVMPRVPSQPMQAAFAAQPMPRAAVAPSRSQASQIAARAQAKILAKAGSTCRPVANSAQQPFTTIAPEATPRPVRASALYNETRTASSSSTQESGPVIPYANSYNPIEDLKRKREHYFVSGAYDDDPTQVKMMGWTPPMAGEDRWGYH
jgi:hypothetical protein